MTYRFYMGHIPKTFVAWVKLEKICTTQGLTIQYNYETLSKDELSNGHDYFIEFTNAEDAVMFRLTNL